MEEEIKDGAAAVNTKKRYILTAELGNKYKSKADFIKAFKEGSKYPVRPALPLNSAVVRPAGHDDQQGLPKAGVRQRQKAFQAGGCQV